jgi:hypothetical protein
MKSDAQVDGDNVRLTAGLLVIARVGNAPIATEICSAAE